MTFVNRMSGTNLGRLPMSGALLFVGVVMASLGIQSVTDLAEKAEWLRTGGFGFTWLTCHLCHWSWEHLVWDLFAFVLLSALCLRIRPTCYVACVLFAGMLIPLEVQFNEPVLTSYRGLSGIDCALFGLVVAALWRPSTRWLAAMASAGFLAKTFYEQMTGLTVFVGGGEVLFKPVPSAHLAGFVAGVAVGGARKIGGLILMMVLSRRGHGCRSRAWLADSASPSLVWPH